MTDTAGLLGERTGEVLGQAAFVATVVGPLYQIGKTAFQNLFFTNINKGVNLARVSTSSAESTTKNCFNSSNFQKRARFSKLEPHKEAQGVHTSFKYNSTRSRINGYETYEKNTFTGEWDRVIRFRGEGKPHGGFNPPYILERSPGKNLGSRPKVPRKPEPWELPNGY